MSIFSKLADQFRQKEVTAAEEFNKLAEAAAADDSKIDPARAFAVLQAAGKTAADFEAAVTLLKNKATWRSQIAAGREAKVEQQKLEMARGKMREQREAELKAIDERWQAKINANETDCQRLAHIVSTGERAEGCLAEGCKDPQLESEIAEKLRLFQIAKGVGTPATEDEYGLAGKEHEAKRIGAELEALRKKAASLVA